MYHPYQNEVSASEACFSFIRQICAGGVLSPSTDGGLLRVGHVSSVIVRLEQVLSLMVPGHLPPSCVQGRSAPEVAYVLVGGVEQSGQDRVAAFERRIKDAVVFTPPRSPGALAGSSLWRRTSSFLGLVHLYFHF